MRKKTVSVFLVLVLFTAMVTGILPAHVHAGARCPECGEWNEDEYCPVCYKGSCCVTICDECGYCNDCMVEAGEHCPECRDACIGEDYGNVPHCMVCLRCESCCDLRETMDGLKCTDCIEEAGDDQYNIICPHCETNIIGNTYDEDDPMDDNLADCGVHCIDCYEAFLCPECGECTLCEEVELCEYCDICENCAVSAGYHCGYCDDLSCYADVGQCPDGGDHCVNCCEDVCEDCGTCTWGAEIEYCEECHKCENCWAHCEICDVCYEEVEQCEQDGEHCRICCYDQGWLCEQCDRCTEALGLEICEYCGLCEDCCAENSAYYGLDTCLLNEEETDLSKINPEDHDENHHILKYQSSSDECHDAWCVFPGCDYAVYDELPHEYLWKTVENATISKEGLREGTCLFCGDKKEEVIPKIETPHYYFIEQPQDMEMIPSKDHIDFYLKIGIENSDEVPKGFCKVAAVPILEGDTLPTSPSKFYYEAYARNVILNSQRAKAHGMSNDPDSTLFPCALYGSFPYTIDTPGWEIFKFHDYVVQGKKLTWRLAIYDSRGGDQIVWSEPFTIDWNAKHTKHTVTYVYGELPPEYKYIGKDTLNNHWSYFAEFHELTYHWQVCSVCGEQLSIPEIHHFVHTDSIGNCKDGGIWRYTCMDCGKVNDQKMAVSWFQCAWSTDYVWDENEHAQYCTICGKRRNNEAHKYASKTTTTCEGTTVFKSCYVCGYCWTKTEPGPGHQFTSDGDFNGWYSDSTDHWHICKVCGKVEKAAHNYVGGACTVCGRDIPQMAIVGSPCLHGGSLTIKLVDDIAADDKAKFLAGQWNATWIDDDTGYTVGMGQSYPLDQGDEGHQYRAEVSIIGGEEYNAYMYGAIKTTYLNVAGYEATCAMEGLLAHQVCQGCGRKFINGQEAVSVIIPKSDQHTFDNDCDPFCNVCGFEREPMHKWSEEYSFTENGHCTECLVCHLAGDLLPHDLTVTILKAAICEQDGLIHKECSLCAYNEDAAIPAPEHKMEFMEAVAATCVSAGCESHYYCAGCGLRTKDAEGKETVGIYHLLTMPDPNNHYGGTEIGYNEQEHYIICVCGEHIEKAAHTFDESGRCTFCHYRKGSNVKTGGKTYTKHDMVLPTCIATGMKEYYTDEDGKSYLSPAGMVEADSTELVLAKSTVRHVGGEYGHSETQHWIDCACGAKLRIADHKFDDHQKCTVCGYQAGSAEPTKPGESTNPTESEEPGESAKAAFTLWLLILIIIAVLIVLGGAAALIIVLVVGKKKKEKEQQNQNQNQNP